MLSDVTSLPLFQVAVSSTFNNKAGEGFFLHHLDDPKILGIQLEVILGTNSICFMVMDEKEAECGPLSVTYSDRVSGRFILRRMIEFNFWHWYRR